MDTGPIVAVRIGSVLARVRGGLHDQFWGHVDRGEWEATTLKAIETLLPNGGVYIDIGAWIGPTVIAAAQKAKRVIAYEPDPLASNYLLENISLNNFDNVEVNQVALWLSAGEMPFGPGNSDSLGNSSSSLTSGNMTTRVKTRNISIESRRDVFVECDLMKIDVEGAEYSIVPIIEGYFRKVRPSLLLSTHGVVIAKGGNSPLKILSYIYSRTKLILALWSYRHLYVDMRDRWDDVDAKWIRINKFIAILNSFRVNRNYEYLFTDEPAAF